MYLGAGPCQDAADATQSSLRFTPCLLSPRTKPPTDNSLQLHPDLLGEEAAAGLGRAANNKGWEWKERGILDVFRNLLGARKHKALPSLQQSQTPGLPFSSLVLQTAVTPRGKATQLRAKPPPAAGRVVARTLYSTGNVARTLYSPGKVSGTFPPWPAARTR